MPSWGSGNGCEVWAPCLGRPGSVLHDRPSQTCSVREGSVVAGPDFVQPPAGAKRRRHWPCVCANLEMGVGGPEAPSQREELGICVSPMRAASPSSPGAESREPASRQPPPEERNHHSAQGPAKPATATPGGPAARGPRAPPLCAPCSPALGRAPRCPLARCTAAGSPGAVRTAPPQGPGGASRGTHTPAKDKDAATKEEGSATLDGRGKGGPRGPRTGNEAADSTTHPDAGEEARVHAPPRCRSPPRDAPRGCEDRSQ
ncbi:translation initiation factor IF-2 [Phacochoerus africanus]|uniref:translation initiation factor IF-2 n=1 Tax=Phacochoerus africanus TaxID=41426 RepID=UPI001FD98ECF|nr:translation initiation factor IF-2 [Phacochoerus africanus]